MSSILFPQSCLPESSLKTLVMLFGPITLFQPWYMNSSLVKSIHDISDQVKILNPPKNKKPKENFQTLLSEYYAWMEYNQDKTSKEILKVKQRKNYEEETSWGIRQVMNQMTESDSSQTKDRIFQWHLILHLANEIEIQCGIAEKILQTIKVKAPILEGAIEQAGDLKNPLEDLTRFQPEEILGKMNIKPVFEAWFGLFNHHLKGKETFITVDERIIDYIEELLESFEEENSIGQSTVHMRIPLPKDNKNYTNEPPEKSVKNKLDELNALLPQIGDDPAQKVKLLDKLSNEFNQMIQESGQDDTVNITITYLEPLGNKSPLQKDKAFKRLQGKPIIYIENR